MLKNLLVGLIDRFDFAHNCANANLGFANWVEAANCDHILFFHSIVKFLIVR